MNNELTFALKKLRILRICKIHQFTYVVIYLITDFFLSFFVCFF